MEELSGTSLEMDKEIEVAENLLAEGIAPAERLTEDDKNDVRTSTNRLLDTNLFLTVRQGGKWILPNLEYPGGIPLRLVSYDCRVCFTVC